MNTPAEVVEAEYPIRVECQRLRDGSGGAGRRRGGEGLHREYRVLCDDMSVTTMFERRVVPPYGLQGGEPGAPFRVTVARADGGGLSICRARPTSGSTATTWSSSRAAAAAGTACRRDRMRQRGRRPMHEHERRAMP